MEITTTVDRSWAQRPWLSYLLFPTVIGAGMGAGIWGIQSGLSADLMVASITVATVVLLAIFERRHPYCRDWNRGRGDVPTDLCHALVSNLLLPRALDLSILAACVHAGLWLSERWQVGLWPGDWPLALQVVLALLVGEFLTYWQHRMSHQVEFLWRFHATHHSASRLYWLNAARFHPVDTALGYLAEVIPLALLGCPPEVMALFVLFTAMHGLFQHANVDVRLGWLNWIFSMSELHRWHHSKTVEEGNSNYGANLIVWDVVFGSRFLPADRLPPDEIGIADMPEFPGAYWQQLMSPFRWAAIRGANRVDQSPEIPGDSQVTNCN